MDGSIKGWTGNPVVIRRALQNAMVIAQQAA